MEVVATAKWIRTTARKARLVTATVEGLPVAEALVILRFTPRAAAHDVANVIKSAAANAEHNYNLDVSTLRVARVEVEAAAIIKRFRPKPRGMAGSIFKRTAHLRAFVTDDEPTPSKRVRSKIRMPRTVVTAPSAGPSREAPASRRRRGGATRPAPATPAAAAETTTPRRRRGASKPAAAAAAEVEETAVQAIVDDSAAEAPDTEAATEVATDTEKQPATDAGEGESN
jgi:large subunit ribosomal protein L22